MDTFYAMKRHAMMAGSIAALALQGALDSPERAMQKQMQDRRDALRIAAEEHQAAALPNANSNWRSTLPMVRLEIAGAGGAAPEFSRQARRKLERDIAHAEASTQRIAARKEAKMQQKRWRAGVA